MSAEIVYGIDFRAKRRQPETIEQFAVSIMGEITVFGFDTVDVGLVPIDTAPSEYWPDGAA